MSKQVETVPVAVVEGAEMAVVTKAEQSPVVDRGLVTQLVGDAQRQGLPVDGEGGLLAELTRLVLESALEGEIADHLGYGKHEKSGSVDGNARNGMRSKTVLTKAGPVAIDVPRDRAGRFTPKIVAKRQRRLGSVEDIVLSLSARGMTHGDISAHLADTCGSDVSKTTISTITDKVLDGMNEWQNRPLDPVYPRSTSTRTTSCASSTTAPSRCSSIRRSAPLLRNDCCQLDERVQVEGGHTSSMRGLSESDATRRGMNGRGMPKDVPPPRPFAQLRTAALEITRRFG